MNEQKHKPQKHKPQNEGKRRFGGAPQKPYKSSPPNKKHLDPYFGAAASLELRSDACDVNSPGGGELGPLGALFFGKCGSP